MKKHIFPYCFFFLWLCPVFAQDANPCKQLFDQKQYALSGACYRKQAEGLLLGESNPLKKKKRMLALQNAAMALSKAGEEEKNPAKGAVFFEESASLLKMILDEKLCTKEYECRSVKGLYFEALQRVGYAELRLENGDSRPLQLSVRGEMSYEHRSTLTKEVLLRLRPGRYEIQTIDAKGKAETEIVLLQREERKSIALRKRAPIPLGSGILMLVGGGLVLIGGVLFGIGQGGLLLDGLRRDNEELKIETGVVLKNAAASGGRISQETFDGLQRRTQTQSEIILRLQTLGLLGLVTAAVGGLVVVAGLIWYGAAARPATPANPPKAALAPSSLPPFGQASSPKHPTLLFQAH
jgi:hypothetical protein